MGEFPSKAKALTKAHKPVTSSEMILRWKYPPPARVRTQAVSLKSCCLCALLLSVRPILDKTVGIRPRR